MPRRFAQLSDRLVTKNGIFLMGTGAVAVLLYSKGQSDLLVLMYSINVFLTFTLTELGMSRYWITTRHEPEHANWLRNLAIHGTGLTMCLSILIVSIVEKFTEGGWVTVVVTSAFIGLAFLIQRHYRVIRGQLRRLDDTLLNIPLRPHQESQAPIAKDRPVAALLVNGYSGLGVHTLLSIQKLFPGQFKDYLFLSVGVIDSAIFKGADEVDALKRNTESDLGKYVDFTRGLGFRAEFRSAIGTEAVEKVLDLAQETRAEYPRSVFFLGALVFERDTITHRILHNETALAIQRRLQFAGLEAVVLPIRVLRRKKSEVA